MQANVFVGQIVHSKSFDEFEVIPNGFIVVDNGRITALGDDYSTWARQNVNKVTEINLTRTQFLMPGLIDCHIHAPQVAQIGLGLDKPLLDWLNSYTFPLESKFADTEFAAKIYKKVVRTTINNGTTMASYFGTNHKESTIILAKEAISQGQRALVGKVCSDCNSPDFYVESTEDSLSATIDFVDKFKELKSDLVQPIVTPRFALSCSEELLKGLGKIAKDRDLHIQSHISESVAEVEFVKEIFKRSYAQTYLDTGLLTDKTVMAHGVHLEDDEIVLFKKTGVSVAHCPSSNTMLSSGLCDVKRLLNYGVKVGLGTDVSGGNSISIKEAILRSMDVSHHLEFIKKQDIKGTGKMSQDSSSYVPINYKQALFLATLGGAQALSVDHRTGNFKVGKEFDALLVDTSIYPLDSFDLSEHLKTIKSPEEKLMELVQKFVYVGDERNISKVYVAGKQIKTGS